MSDNTITVVGNITKEPELKFLGSGNAAVKFSIAVNKRRKGKDGEYEESTSFFDVQAFGHEGQPHRGHRRNRTALVG